MSDQVSTNVQPQSTFSEAKAVAFTQLYGVKDGEVIQINVTARAENVSDAIEQLFSGASAVKDKYHLKFTNPNLRKAPEAKALESSAPGATAAATSGPQRNAATQGGMKVINAVKLEIKPSADGKVSLNWFAANHQYPDIYTTRSAEKALELLRSTGEAWEEVHIQKVGVFTIRHDVIYRESEKTNSKGNPYKDIVEIRKV